jgi:NAD(P)H-dependent flavin oxidoreductase YrpB (nitropropane dioxygenase family)
MTRDPLKTVICERFGCEYPIFAFTHYPQVAAAVTNAGGVGILGAGWGNDPKGPEALRERIRWVRNAVGDKPFGVDLILPASVPDEASPEQMAAMIPEEHRRFAETIKREYSIPDPKNPPSQPALTGEFIRQMLGMLYEEKVPAFASGLGSPAGLISEMHEHGMTVISLVGKPRHAVKSAAAGADVIVAQGTEAAGHTGEIGTLSLVPQVADAVRSVNPGVPVLAAGGIASGRQLIAALGLGAAGVWTGTIWLPTAESGLEEILKRKLVEAGADQTIRSDKRSGYTARFLRSKYDDVWQRPDAPRHALPMPLQGIAYGDIEQATNDHEMQEWMTTPASQSVGLITGLRPAAEVFQALVTEARQVLAGTFGQ